MENITLGQIAAAIGIIGIIYGGYKGLNKTITETITKVVKDLLAPITKSIDDLDKKLNAVDMEISKKLKSVDMETCKNFLVRCLADVERGDQMTEIEKERFWEQYEYYIDHGGNTYIKNKVEKLKEQGRL